MGCVLGPSHRLGAWPWWCAIGHSSVVTTKGRRTRGRRNRRGKWGMKNSNQKPFTTTTTSSAVRGNFVPSWRDGTPHWMAQLTKTPRLSLRLHVLQATVLRRRKLSSRLLTDGQNQAQKKTEKKRFGLESFEYWLGIRFNMLQSKFVWYQSQKLW